MAGRLYDVIVIGAGPGGTTAARQCALKGLTTLLIEKKEFPRYKPCAGAISSWALPTLDFEVPQDIIEQECFGARFSFKGISAEACKSFRVGVMVSRSVFDHLLLQKASEAGSDVLLATEARDFRTGPDHIEVSTNNGSHRGQCVVIAEGGMGRLAKRIRGPYGRNEVAMAMVTEVESSQDEIDRRTAGRIQVHFNVAHRGYGWIFPHRGYYSVGIAGTRGRIANPVHLLREFLATHGFEARQRLRGHFIPAGGIHRRLAAHRVLLVGDAAGFVDSLTGEGIGYAILSGKLAAETIHEALGHGPVSRIDLTPFQNRCDTDFGARLRDANFLSRILHSLPGVFLKNLATQPTAIAKLLEATAWRISYREFLIWFLVRIPGYLL